MSPLRGALAALVASGLLADPTYAAGGSLESSPAVHVVTFSVTEGRIYVNLPGDLAPGDAAGATVNPVAGGATEADRARGREELSRYAVELGGQRAPASQGLRTFAVPAGASRTSVKLFDAGGRAAGEVEVPLRAAAPAPAAYVVPTVGQGGGSVRIAGSFDGDLSNSTVHLGGAPLQPMAESPRQLVVRGPEQGAAAAPIEVRERGTVVAAGTYRNVSVRLSAPLTSLLSGQRTTLTVTVGGLEGLEQTLPVRLTNQSPDVVSMEGGEQQTLCVRPGEVKTDGTWTKARGLTGVRAGGFRVDTAVTPPGPQVESTAPVDATLRGELLAGLQLDRDARTAAGQRLASGRYQVAVRGAGDRGRVRLHLFRDGTEAGTLDGAVLKRVAGAAVCDLRDVSDAHDQAVAGSGEPRFGELGFNEGSAFVVREGGRGRWMVLAAGQGPFSIEAPLHPDR